ncbi:hypothetical protein ABVK25_003859 [Lepraria finkii]|uniref:Uncharacterized protein n=1 Tax=Lepraria finkii TaxID=1340010 RepID=A0ABR4BCN7_9LECA
MLRANCQIHHEATSILYDEISFVFTGSTPEVEIKMVMSMANYRSSSRRNKHKNFDIRPFQYNSTIPQTTHRMTDWIRPMCLPPTTCLFFARVFLLAEQHITGSYLSGLSINIHDT